MKTIDVLWKKYREVGLSEKMAEDVVEKLRIVFYMGACSLMQVVVNSTSLDEEEFIEYQQSILTELDEFKLRIADKPEFFEGQ